MKDKKSDMAALWDALIKGLSSEKGVVPVKKPVNGVGSEATS